MTRYWYYVGFIASSGNALNSGGSEIGRDAPVTTMDDIRELQDWMRKHHHQPNLTVVAVSPLRTDVVPEPAATS